MATNTRTFLLIIAAACVLQATVLHLMGLRKPPAMATESLLLQPVRP